MQTRLKSLWLAETVRLIEQSTGRFADAEANRQARNIDGSLSSRIIARATFIAKQNGLLNAQKQLISSMKIALFIVIIFAAFIGAGLAISALSQTPVNLYWALFSLLGVHVVTLLIWLFSFWFLPSDSGSFFIHIWFWLTQKLTKKQTIQQLLPALLSLFNQQTRWFIGFVVNLVWSILLGSTLVLLVILLSTKYYSFSWQTTLLDLDTVTAITQNLGYLPSLLGFDMPNFDMIRISDQALNESDIRSLWAMWLLGVFVVYGFLVRFILMMLCGIKWWIICRQLTLNVTHPEYQLLAMHLQPLSTSVVDPQHQFPTSISAQSYIEKGDKAVLVAIDIESSWQPPSDIIFLGFLNSSQQRKQILDFLQVNPSQKLLIAIDSNRAPDRGILNLIEQLVTKSVEYRIWFINQGQQLANWQSINFKTAEPSWLKEGTL